MKNDEKYLTLKKYLKINKWKQFKFEKIFGLKEMGWTLQNSKFWVWRRCSRLGVRTNCGEEYRRRMKNLTKKNSATRAFHRKNNRGLVRYKSKYRMVPWIPTLECYGVCWKKLAKCLQHAKCKVPKILWEPLSTMTRKNYDLKECKFFIFLGRHWISDTFCF